MRLVLLVLLAPSLALAGAGPILVPAGSTSTSAAPFVGDVCVGLSASDHVCYDERGANGSTLTTDAAPSTVIVSGKNAAAAAATNKTGGNIELSGGIATTTVVIDSYAVCATDTVTITIDGTATVRTEGTHWTAATSNAATCVSLASALDALTGVSASCSTATVLVTPDATTHTVTLAESDATCTTVSANAAGYARSWSPLVVPDGSATSGGVCFASDYDATPTCLYRAAANRIGIAINGVALGDIRASGTDLQIDTANNLLMTQGGTTYLTMKANANAQLQLGSTAHVGSGADGVVQLYNGNFTDFNRVTFGGTTTAFPSLARSGADLVVKLGDGTGRGNLLFSHVAATIAADDATPDVSGANVFTTSANVGATAITDLDSPDPGQIVTICGGSDTNSSTIADAGNFNLSGAFTAALDDCITLLVQADNDYVEISRVNN